MITLVLRAFLVVDKDEYLILILLCKANLECKEICVSDWLKPISTVLALLFYNLYTFQIWFCVEAYL